MLKMLNYKFYSDFFYPRNLQEIRGIGADRASSKDVASFSMMK